MNPRELGTPKSLEESIKRGFTTGQSIPQVIQNVDKHVQDYLAQHFTTAMLKCDEHDLLTQMILQELWNSITGRQMYGESQASSIMSNKGNP